MQKMTMKGQLVRHKTILLAMPMLFSLAAGCKIVRKQPLPERQPRVPLVKFTGPSEGFPPKPMGRTGVRMVPWKAIPESLTDEREAEIRRAAERDLRVLRALGERHAYLSTDEIEPQKRLVPIRPRGLSTRVTFFSHSNNVEVEVLMRGTKVRSVNQLKGTSPPAGAEEIQLAIELARQDQRLAALSDENPANAMVTPTFKEMPAYGNRVLDVMFFEADRDRLPTWRAYVDLTERTVLAAGPLKR